MQKNKKIKIKQGKAEEKHRFINQVFFLVKKILHQNFPTANLLRETLTNYIIDGEMVPS